MALPIPSDLNNMQWAFRAQPFINVPSKTSIELDNMQYAFQAQPFVGNEGGAVITKPGKTSVAGRLIASEVI